jgi:hypothetical protein
MRRPKSALLVVFILASAVAFLWCRGAEASPKEKKRGGKPAGSTNKPNPSSSAAPGKPGAPKPGAAAQSTSSPAAPARSEAASPVSPGTTANNAENQPVPLGGKNDGKTINFSSGKPVITDTPEDKVAIRSALRDFTEAAKGVVFGPARKKPVTLPDAPKN